jgi:transposase
MTENGKERQTIVRTEVEPRAERQYYTKSYKKQILAEIDTLQGKGEIGSLLRREGLYSQLISKWRDQLELGRLETTERPPSGRKSETQAEELARLRRENERLQARLERAELILDVQKKVSGLLGRLDIE